MTNAIFNLFIKMNPNPVHCNYQHYKKPICNLPAQPGLGFCYRHLAFVKEMNERRRNKLCIGKLNHFLGTFSCDLPTEEGRYFCSVCQENYPVGEYSRKRNLKFSLRKDYRTTNQVSSRYRIKEKPVIIRTKPFVALTIPMTELQNQKALSPPGTPTFTSLAKPASTGSIIELTGNESPDKLPFISTDLSPSGDDSPKRRDLAESIDNSLPEGSGSPDPVLSRMIEGVYAAYYTYLDKLRELRTYQSSSTLSAL